MLGGGELGDKDLQRDGEERNEWGREDLGVPETHRYPERSSFFFLHPSPPCPQVWVCHDLRLVGQGGRADSEVCGNQSRMLAGPGEGGTPKSRWELM